MECHGSCDDGSGGIIVSSHLAEATVLKGIRRRPQIKSAISNGFKR